MLLLQAFVVDKIASCCKTLLFNHVLLTKWLPALQGSWQSCVVARNASCPTMISNNHDLLIKQAPVPQCFLTIMCWWKNRFLWHNASSQSCAADIVICMAQCLTGMACRLYLHRITISVMLVFSRYMSDPPYNCKDVCHLRVHGACWACPAWWSEHPQQAWTVSNIILHSHVADRPWFA